MSTSASDLPATAADDSTPDYGMGLLAAVLPGVVAAVLLLDPPPVVWLAALIVALTGIIVKVKTRSRS